jgi:acetyltransferase-like isoleucine patch superfamily enzyme
MAEVVIFGSGRGADIAARYITADSEHEVVAFTVEEKYLDLKFFRGLPIIPFETLELFYPPLYYSLFIPLGYQGMNRLRAEKYLEGKRRGYSFISYASSKIATHDELKIGENCFLLENSSINFDVKIGNNVVVWSGCQLGDQSVIQDHVWISSHASLAGQVTVGEYSFLGINCTISNFVKVASGGFIGPSTLITKDTDTNGVYLNESSKSAPISSDNFLSFIDAIRGNSK